MTYSITATSMNVTHDPFAVIGQSPDWMRHGACADIDDADVFFPGSGPLAAAAKKTCKQCPVSTLCLQYALERPELRGVWGGTNEEQRRNLRKESA